MWTWRTLGYDRVSELQAHLLSILGCRCRTIEDGGAGAPSPGRASQSTWTSFGGTKDALASSGSEVLLNEQGGPIELEMLGAAAGATPSAWRVTNFGTLRVCIPGAVAVEQGPAPAVFPDPLVVDTAAFAEGQVQQRGGVARQQTASDGGLQSALATLLQLGGGTCYYQVPCVDVHLRDDIATECCAETAAPGYTQCVVGVVLGAVLKLKLSIAAGLPGKGDGSPTQLPHVPGTPDPEGVQHVVTGDGFQLRIVQTGGPPLDPAKMSSHTTEGVAKELYTWAKKAASKLPTSWRTLYVCCRPGQAESLSRSFSGRTAEQYSQQHGRTAGLGVAFRGGRQLGDILLVASADAELKLEPFELTYGTAHLNSLRRMFEDEIATALGIPSEQVLCGEFLPYGGRGAPRKRHLRRETVTLQFCFLSPELAKLARPPSSTEPSPSAGAAAKNRLQDGNPVSPASPGKMSSLMRTSTSQSLQASGRMAMFPLKRDASSNLASTETSMQLAATLMSTPALSNTLQNVDGVRKTLAMTLSQNPKKADTGDAGALIPEAQNNKGKAGAADNQKVEMNLYDAKQNEAAIKIQKMQRGRATRNKSKKSGLALWKKAKKHVAMVSTISKNCSAFSAEVVLGQDAYDEANDQHFEELMTNWKPRRQARATVVRGPVVLTPEQFARPATATALPPPAPSASSKASNQLKKLLVKVSAPPPPVISGNAIGNGSEETANEISSSRQRMEEAIKRAEGNAATNLQALVRGHLGRKNLKAPRKTHAEKAREGKKKDENDAATQIQAHYRGRRCRKDVQARKEANGNAA